MSFQWSFIAGYLYFEILCVILLILPIGSPRRWKQFFRSRMFVLVRNQAAFYFYVLLGLLGLFLLDAIREMRKYSHSTGSHTHLASEMKGNVKMFRAQRNFYITGFAIFLAFVIKRLVTMILIQAELLEKSERIIQEAESAKNLAKSTVLAHTLQSAGDAQDSIRTLETSLQQKDIQIQELEKKVIALKLSLKAVTNNENSE